VRHTPEHASVAQDIAASALLSRSDPPFLAAVSDVDPGTRGGEAVFQQLLPGVQGQPHCTLKGSHFMQEAALLEIVQLIATRVHAPVLSGLNPEPHQPDPARRGPAAAGAAVADRHQLGFSLSMATA
jgi:hypothetical protein